MKKKVYAVLSFVSFIYILGICGGIDNDTIGLEAGFLRMVIGLIAWVMFAYLAGAFEDKEAAAESSSFHDGKRNVHKQYNNPVRKNQQATQKGAKCGESCCSKRRAL